MTERLNEAELAKIVKYQKRRIQQIAEQRDEARDVARQLLYELRKHVETPATHADYHWLREPEQGITEERAGDSE